MRPGKSAIRGKSFVQIGRKSFESTASERVMRSQHSGKMPGVEALLCGRVEISVRDLVHTREPGWRRIDDDAARQDDYERGAYEPVPRLHGEDAENDGKPQEAAARIGKYDRGDAANENEPDKHAQLFILLGTRQKEEERQCHIDGHGQEIIVFDK